MNIVFFILVGIFMGILSTLAISFSDPYLPKLLQVLPDVTMKTRIGVVGAATMLLGIGGLICFLYGLIGIKK